MKLGITRRTAASVPAGAPGAARGVMGSRSQEPGAGKALSHKGFPAPGAPGTGATGAPWGRQQSTAPAPAQILAADFEPRRPLIRLTNRDKGIRGLS